MPPLDSGLRRNDNLASDSDAQDALRAVIVTSEDPLYINPFFERLFQLSGGYPALDSGLRRNDNRMPPLDSGLRRNDNVMPPLDSGLRRNDNLRNDNVMPALDSGLRRNDNVTPVKILRVVNLKAFNAASTFALAKKMMQFYGVWDFTRQGLRYAHRRITAPGLEALARRNGIPVMRVGDINSAGFLADMEALAPDVIVSVAAPQIFRRRILNLPRLGCWNVHGGMLPKYRGMMPSFWTMLGGENVGAVTVHKMNTRLDDGGILVQRTYPLVRGESLHQLILRSKRLAAETLLGALELLHSGEYKLLPNDSAAATYFSFPAPADARRFRRLGMRLV